MIFNCYRKCYYLVIQIWSNLKTFDSPKFLEWLKIWKRGSTSLVPYSVRLQATPKFAGAQTLATETSSAVSTLNRRLRTQSRRRSQATASSTFRFSGGTPFPIFSRWVPDASRQSTARQHLSHLRSINAVQLGGGEDGTWQPQPLSSLQGIPCHSAMPRTRPY